MVTFRLQPENFGFRENTSIGNGVRLTQKSLVWTTVVWTHVVRLMQWRRAVRAWRNFTQKPASRSRFQVFSMFPLLSVVTCAQNSWYVCWHV